MPARVRAFKATRAPRRLIDLARTCPPCLPTRVAVHGSQRRMAGELKKWVLKNLLPVSLVCAVALGAAWPRPICFICFENVTSQNKKSPAHTVADLNLKPDACTRDNQ